ncbi:MAG: hypothetical protein D6160_16410 [Ketobacter sp.]|nr:MAG: hypothetical protein D6160_16410 [Ketobacter sp.]
MIIRTQNNKSLEEIMSTIDGAWNLILKAPNGEQQSVLTLKSEGDALTGTIANDSFGVQDIEDGKYDGETLSWKSKITKPMKLTLTYTATLDENNNIKGKANAMMAKIPFTGTPV